MLRELSELSEAMQLAIEKGRTDIVKSILDVCADDNLAKEVGRKNVLDLRFVEDLSFLALATKLNKGDVVRTLLAAGSDPNVTNNEGQNAFNLASTAHMKQIYADELLRATATSQVGRVCQLLCAGVSVNCNDSRATKNTPLHWAACYSNTNTVSCLIDSGADVNAVNSYGATALHEAASRGRLDVARELLHAGADPAMVAAGGHYAGKSALDMMCAHPRLAGMLTERTSATGCVAMVPLSREGRSVSVDSYHGSGETDQPKSITPPLITRGLSSSSLDLSPRLDQIMDQLKGPVKPLVTHPSLHLLWPQPQRMTELPGQGFVPPRELHVSITRGTTSVHRILDVWEVHRSSLVRLGYDVRVKDIQPSCGRPSTSHIECTVNAALFSDPVAYQIHIKSDKVRLSSGSVEGLHYALCTLTQLLRLATPSQTDGDVPHSADSSPHQTDSAQPEPVVTLHPVLIRDHPTMRHRAVLLDVSPNTRVPTLDCLFDMIDNWASLKISHLHLYSRLMPISEWQLCFKKSEMVTIDRHCQDRFINLVPVLDIEGRVQKQDLAGMWPAFQEILASFTSVKYVHVGPGLSSLMLEGECGGLQEAWRLLSLPPQVTLMVCSNSLHNTDLTGVTLPHNVVLIEYGFQADYDFLEWTREFHQMGCTTCFCPGTASWNSLGGCPEASICNIYRAVEGVLETDSLGVVVAHWSGSYHLTPHPFSWPGFLVAAGLAWNANTHKDYLQSWVGALLDAHVFLDTSGGRGTGSLGAVVLELGHAETHISRAAANCQAATDVTGLPPHTGSVLHQLITDPDNVQLDHLSTDLFARMTKHIKRSLGHLHRSQPQCRLAETTLREMTLTADLMLTACKVGRSLVATGANPNSNMGLAVINLGVANLPPTFRTDIANKLLALIEQYKGTWLQRHLPAGLQGSLVVLNNALRRFVPDEST